MSSAAKNRRKAEVKLVREQGREAALAGKHAQTNPYPTYSENRYQWFMGYQEGALETNFEALAENNEQEV